VTLLDTSSLVHFLRLKGDSAVKARVKGILLRGDAVLCGMVIVEIYMGVASPADENDVRRLSKVLPCLPTNEDVWRMARALGAACRRAGTPVPSSDVLIASCAYVNGAEIEADDAHFDLLRTAHDSLI
jgi:predicted nucleic acid-binding protein